MDGRKSLCITDTPPEYEPAYFCITRELIQ